MVLNGDFMARTKAVLDEGRWLSDYFSIAALTRSATLERVREVLVELGLQSQRRRDFPAEVVVYFTIAMSLFRSVAYDEVTRTVVESLRKIFGDSIADVIPSKSAISQARARLGSRPFEVLYREQASVCGNPDKPGVMFHGFRVMTLAGNTVEVPDEKANAEYYGYTGLPGRAADLPSLRFAALVECATQVMIGAQMGPYRMSELELAKEAVKSADGSMLVLADRGLSSYSMWVAAGAQGCRRLFRVAQNRELPVMQVLSDGSWISEIYSGQKARNLAKLGKRAAGVERVRVIEYEVRKKGTDPTRCQLITDFMDENAVPARELAALYHRRLNIEATLDELLVHQNESRVFRSKTPELVRQEFFAMLIAHTALRKLISDATATLSLAPDDQSFAAAVRIVRGRMPASGPVST